MHYSPHAEGFIPVTACSGHGLVSVLFTEDVSNRCHHYLQAMSRACCNGHEALHRGGCNGGCSTIIKTSRIAAHSI